MTPAEQKAVDYYPIIDVDESVCTGHNGILVEIGTQPELRRAVSTLKMYKAKMQECANGHRDTIPGFFEMSLNGKTVR